MDSSGEADYCMGQETIEWGDIDHQTSSDTLQCGKIATRFEEDPNHWHDWVWCDKHAKGRTTVPLEEIK